MPPKGGGYPLQITYPSGCPIASASATPGTRPRLPTGGCHMDAHAVGEESALVGSSPIHFRAAPPFAGHRQLGGSWGVSQQCWPHQPEHTPAVPPMGVPPTLRCSSTAGGPTAPQRGPSPSSASWAVPHTLATTLSSQRWPPQHSPLWPHPHDPCVQPRA